MKYLSEYRALHRSESFRGYSILQWVPQIADLVAEHKSVRLLDYGCGLGWQYIRERVHLAMGVEVPHLYDPAVDALSTKPEGTFDGVICTDVMEHVPEEEVDAVVREIAAYAEDWAFVSVCCRPSKHIRFPDGTNVHVTVKPFQWWTRKLQPVFAGRKLVLVETP